MALINCPECEKEISDKVKACPHCGFPIAEEVQESIMESNKEEMKEEVETKENNKENQGINFWSYTAAKILLGLVVLSLCLSVFSIISRSDTDIEEKLDNQDLRISFIEEKLDNLDLRMSLIDIGIDMTEGKVTDKAVVQKASFYISDINEISGVIDIRPQPIYNYKFLGQGDFDLTDRELKSMVQEIIKEVKDDSDFKSMLSTYKMSLETIYITEKNYNVAEYTDGKVTLAGE